MSEDLLEQIYVRLSEYPFDRIKIIWHGGEPLLMDIGFYEKAMQFQKRHLKNRIVINNIQTNGSLINNKWCNFLKNNRFSIGVSLDGYRVLNKYRKYPNGEEAFYDILRGISFLRNTKIGYGLLAVVDNRICGHEEEFYNFMKSESNSFRLNIVVPYGNGKKNVHTFSQKELNNLAESFIKMYDIWKNDCSGNSLIQVFPFAEMVQSLVSHKVHTCSFAPNGCSSIVSISHDGSVYGCGRFSEEKDFFMGNIKMNSFQDLEQSDIALMKKGRASIISKECSDCRFLSICNGGCAQVSYAITGDYNHKSPYCIIYRRLFEYIEKDVLMLIQNKHSLMKL